MYVPVNGLDSLLKLSHKQLEYKILQAIEYQPATNTFAFKGVQER